MDPLEHRLPHDLRARNPALQRARQIRARRLLCDAGIPVPHRADGRDHGSRAHFLYGEGLHDCRCEGPVDAAPDAAG